MTIHIPVDIPLNRLDVEYILLDALSEFINARTPSEEYVARRYRECDDSFKEEKVQYTDLRLIMADHIKAAVFNMTITSEGV